MKFVRGLRWDGEKFLTPEGHTLRVRCLEKNLFRVTLLRHDAWVMPRTWSIAWDASDVPFEGVDRDQLPGFSNPPLTVRATSESVRLAHEDFAANVDLTSGTIDWHFQGKSVLRERPTDAYGLGMKTLWHAHELRPGVAFHGLGEATGPLDRRGRDFEMRNLDAMGYDAETGDPLYKHYPFLIQRDGEMAVGLFYDNFATARFNLGREKDNYHGPYFSYRADGGDLDFYVMAGPSVAAVTKLFTRLTGRPRLTPAWALGFSGSTMTYTDAPDAQVQLGGFLDKIAETRLPCTSFHLSSGYTSIGKKRYVFHWNREKIPDPAGLVRSFSEKGIRLIPNIKPVLLTDHPRYQEATEKNLFINAAGVPEQSQFWDGLGSHLDFTNPATVAWWQENIREQLCSHGIEAVWNDNNEYQVWDLAARTHTGFPMKLLRPVQTMLMAKASLGAVDFAVSRSGMPGMQRYVQTWSGDNTTDWKTLRFNLCMALNLSLSGMSNIGHDVGGFAGPKPSAELFIRWIQHGIFYPRFVIHSWKPEGVNEPWMFPEWLGHVRELFSLREKLQPYFRKLQLSAHHDFEPFLRPLLHEFPQDAIACKIEDQFMVGPALLVANVFDAGATTRRTYLPAGEWTDFWTKKTYTGERWIDFPVTLETWPLLIKGGETL